MNINPIFLKDFYKVGHIEQYPRETNLIFSNFTPRRSMIKGINHSVFFGLQYFLKEYLIKQFNELFFKDSLEGNMIRYEYEKLMQATLGTDAEYHFDHIDELKDLGYLPIAIYALPELSIVPCGVPALVMFNTNPDFYWLPNMLETLLSCTMWGACTSATIAREYRLMLDKYAAETSDIPGFVDYQAHDFSMRGMSSVESACISGMAHLQYFKGTDTIPAMLFNQEYYDKPLHMASVPATEHSVMSSYEKGREVKCFLRLIKDIYPKGIVSIVSDTWDLWNVVENILPAIKDEIMKRDGKVVIRPDSGDPADILCGKLNDSPFGNFINPFATKGLIECLWDIFGGTINDKGFKQLDVHIGAIYGDNINLDRARDICERLKLKGFASTNIVFGIGSFSFQYNTRDTLGWAMKSTYIELNGIGRAITKDPITDSGVKKSHSGILKVVKVDGAHGHTYQVLQNQTWDQFNQEDNELKLVFNDSKLVK